MRLPDNRVQVDSQRFVSDGEWRRLVEACNGNALHLPATHLPDCRAGDLRFLMFRDGDDVLACALGIVSRRRLLGALPLGPQALLLPTAPAWADPVRAPAVLAALAGHARDAGFVRLVVQPRYSAHLDSHEVFAGQARPAIVEFVLDLRRPLDEILAQMHKTHRKNVRRATSRGVEVEEDTSLEGLLRLRGMQEVSAERASERQHGFAVRDEAWFRRAYEHVYAGGPGRVLFARHGGEYVAGLAFLTAAGRTLTVRSGALPAGYETYAMYLLHYELIRSLQERGVRELNLGGVPVGADDPGHPQSGLYEFKKGFGSQPVTRIGVDARLR